MNDYFVAVGSNLASQINPIPNSRDLEHIYRITPTLSSISLNKSDLLRRINIINPNKASGPDSIAPRDLHIIGEASILFLDIACLTPLFHLNGKYPECSLPIRREENRQRKLQASPNAEYT